MENHHQALLAVRRPFTRCHPGSTPAAEPGAALRDIPAALFTGPRLPLPQARGTGQGPSGISLRGVRSLDRLKASPASPRQRSLQSHHNIPAPAARPAPPLLSPAPLHLEPGTPASPSRPPAFLTYRRNLARGLARGRQLGKVGFGDGSPQAYGRSGPPPGTPWPSSEAHFKTHLSLGAPGWRSWLRVRLLVWAGVVLLGSWGQAACGAPHSWRRPLGILSPLSPPLPPRVRSRSGARMRALALSLSQTNKS